jgi:hypothetical protein
MWTRMVVIVLSLMVGIPVSYGQGTKTLPEPKPVRFTQGGYQYTVQSTLRDGRLETVVRYTPAAARSSVKPGEVRVVLGRRDVSVTSRTGDGSTITLTQVGPRLSAIISHDGKTVRKEGTESEVMRFFEEQDKTAGSTRRGKTQKGIIQDDGPRGDKTVASTRQGKTDLPLGEFVAKDRDLRAQLQKSIIQTIEELKERRKKDWQQLAEEMARRCKEDPGSPGCPNASLCGRADQCCSGGSVSCCAVGLLCDFVAWVFEP